MACYKAGNKGGRKNIAKCIKALKLAKYCMRTPWTALVCAVYIYHECKDAYDGVKE